MAQLFLRFQLWLLLVLIHHIVYASPGPAEMVLGAAQKLAQAGRSGLLVECNNKKGLGVTLRGTRR